MISHIDTHIQRLFLSFVLEKKKEVKREEREALLRSYLPSFATPYRDRIKAILRHFRHPRFGRCCVKGLLIVRRDAFY